MEDCSLQECKPGSVQGLVTAMGRLGGLGLVGGLVSPSIGMRGLEGTGGRSLQFSQRHIRHSESWISVKSALWPHQRCQKSRITCKRGHDESSMSDTDNIG
jgi:hypothetical protein